MTSGKIRVAICGGGITGAALANLLLKQPDKIEVQVYEAAKHFDEIGAGIGLWGRALEVFKLAGMYEEVLKVAIRPDSKDPELSMVLRIGDQKPKGFTFGEWRYDGGPLFFHRATLLDVLVAHLPSERVHFNKRLASFTNNTEGVTLHFADRTEATADILVGCDGIKSAVRRQMYTEIASETGASIEEYLDKYIVPTWSGTRAYRTLIPVDQLEKVNADHSCLKTPMVYFGRNKHLIVYRPNETHINVVAFISDPSKEGTQYPDAKWVRDAAQEELLEAFEDFEEEAQQMFELMPKPSLWAINCLKETLPTFIRGNTVLMGDAAHAMTPHLGIGAGMSIEDAGVFTQFLTSPHITRANYSLALKAFDTARAQKTAEILHRARTQGHVYEYYKQDVGRNPEKIKEFLQENTGAIINWDAQDDVREGLDWIKNQSVVDRGDGKAGRGKGENVANGGVSNGGHLRPGKKTLRFVVWFSRKFGIRK